MREDNIQNILKLISEKLKNKEIESINLIIRNGKSEYLQDLLSKVGVKEVTIINLDQGNGEENKS